MKKNPVIYFIYNTLALSLEKAMATHSSTLAWRNPEDGGAWWATIHGVMKSWTQLSDFTFTFHFHALEKDTATHSSVLTWRIPWTEEPGGLQSLKLQSQTRQSDLAHVHEDRGPVVDSGSVYCRWSVSKSGLTLWDPMDCSTPDFPVLHYLPEFAQTHIYRVGDAIQPSHPLSSPSPLVLSLSQH